MEYVHVWCIPMVFSFIFNVITVEILFVYPPVIEICKHMPTCTHILAFKVWYHYEHQKIFSDSLIYIK